MISVEKVLFEKLTGMHGEVTSRITARQFGKPNNAMGLRVSRVANSADIVMTMFYNGRSLGYIRMTEAEMREHEGNGKEV